MNLNQEECRRLIAGLVDGELTPEEKIAANECLQRSEECRREYQQMVEVSARLKRLSILEPEDEVLESLWRAPHHRLAWNLGLWLVFASVAGWVVYGGWHLLRYFFTSDEDPLLLKLILSGVLLGGLLIGYCILRERLKTYKVDRYKEIKR